MILNFLKKIIKGLISLYPRSKEYKLDSLIPELVPKILCVDVGASYYAHPAWGPLQRSAQTTWLAVDPNASNLGYVRSWPWPSKVIPISEALTKEGGSATLYVTNIDSGSSLLAPIIHPSMEHRTDQNYFFPLKEVQLETQSLEKILNKYEGMPIALKLDTQGSEFDIISGLSEKLIRDRIICIELETTLLANPYYQNSGRFYDVMRYLEALGFELASLDPIASRYPLAGRKLSSRNVLVECDALFIKRPDIIQDFSYEYQLAVLAIYLTYRFYGEAIYLQKKLVSGDHKSTTILRKLEHLLS